MEEAAVNLLLRKPQTRSLQPPAGADTASLSTQRSSCKLNAAVQGRGNFEHLFETAQRKPRVPWTLGAGAIFIRPNGNEVSDFERHAPCSEPVDDCHGKSMPARLTRTGQMDRSLGPAEGCWQCPEVVSDNLAEAASNGRRGRWRTNLVSNDSQLLSFTGKSDDGAKEILPAAVVDPGGPDDEVGAVGGANGGLPRELGLAINRQRCWSIILTDEREPDPSKI